jgi:hypothetical protein
MLFKLLLLLPVQTVWPQSGPILRPDDSSNMHTSSNVTDFFYLFFFKDKPLCFQRRN